MRGGKSTLQHRDPRQARKKYLWRAILLSEDETRQTDIAYGRTRDDISNAVRNATNRPENTGRVVIQRAELPADLDWMQVARK